MNLGLTWGPKIFLKNWPLCRHFDQQILVSGLNSGVVLFLGVVSLNVRFHCTVKDFCQGMAYLRVEVNIVCLSVWFVPRLIRVL